MENQIKNIDQAIFELGEDTVIKKRKSIVTPIMVIAAGIALIALSAIPSVAAHDTALVTLQFFGWVTVISGLVYLMFVAFGKAGNAFHVPSGEFLKRKEFLYDSDRFGEVNACLETGNLEALAQIPAGNTNSVMLISYKGAKTGVTYCQLFRYVPHNYEPAGEMRFYGFRNN